MFVRKKRNRSGTTSVSVVFKNGRTFKEVHHLGSSADPAEIQRMYNEGREWIALYGGQQLIDFEEKWREHQAEAAAVEQAIAEVKNSLDRKTLLLGECKWTKGENGRLLTNKLQKLAQHLPFAEGKKLIIKLFTKVRPEEDMGNALLPEDLISL